MNHTLPRIKRNETNEILFLASKKFSEAVIQSFSDMVGVQLAHTDPELFEDNAIRGVTVYAHFIGGIQGMFILNIAEADCEEILELNPQLPDEEQELIGFLSECLNVAVGLSLPLLESTYGHLTYSPSMYINGTFQFPRYAGTQALHFTQNGKTIHSNLHLDLAEIRISRELDLVRQQLAETQKNANTDPATQLFSRNYFDRTYGRMIQDCHDRQHTMTLIWMRIDDLGGMNKEHTEATGDRALKKVGESISHCVRNNDLAFRYDGNAFIILLATAPMEAGLKVAKNINEFLKESPILVDSEEPKKIVLSTCMGLATLIPNENSIDFLDRAGALLKIAKDKGPNSIVSSNEWNY